MISPYLRWDHSEDWFVTKFEMKKSNSGERKVTIALSDQEFEYMSGHTIDGD
jgi:fatty acid synthase, animal type